MNDRDLTRLLQTDPDAGLQAAMQAYASLVKAVLLRILPRDPRDVEECIADTFVSLWRHAAALEQQKTPLRPWLLVTARNKGIDRYHALCRHAVLSLDEELGQTLGRWRNSTAPPRMPPTGWGPWWRPWARPTGKSSCASIIFCSPVKRSPAPWA